MASTRKKERGIAAVFVAVVISALLGILGLVLNLGYRWSTEAQLQNAADAAALAAARELNGTMAPISAGLPANLAISFAGRHVSGADVPVTIGGVDVQLGRWDPFATDPWTAFTPVVPRNDAEAWNVNAVRVLDGREASRGSALDVWLSAFLGNKTTQDVASEAVAVNGGPCDQACPTVPFAFFDCNMPENFQEKCGTTFRTTIVEGTTGPDPTDTMGFTSLNTGLPASTNVYRDILSGNNCSTYSVRTGEPIPISNGSQLQPLCSYIQPWIGQKTQAPVVHGECPPRFNQAHPVIGFATLRIDRVVGCPWDPAPGGVATKYIQFTLLCNEKIQDSDRVGCGFFGTGTLQPKLVR